MTKIDLRYVHMPNKQERQDPLLLAPTWLPPVRLPGDLQSLELAEQATKLNIAATVVRSSRNGRAIRKLSAREGTRSAG